MLSGLLEHSLILVGLQIIKNQLKNGKYFESFLLLLSLLVVVLNGNVGWRVAEIDGGDKSNAFLPFMRVASVTDKKNRFWRFQNMPCVYKSGLKYQKWEIKEDKVRVIFF